MSDLYADSDQFQYWLMQMDEQLAAFLTEVPTRLREQLDGTEGSLDALEAWLLERYPSLEAARPASQARVLDGAARYIGEILRKRTGSRWSIRFDDSFVFRGLPILIGGSAYTKMPECPLTIISASLDRRTGKYLSSVVSKTPAAAGR